MNYILVLMISACVAASEPYETMFIAPKTLAELVEIMDRDLGRDGQRIAGIVKNLVENKNPPEGDGKEIFNKVLVYCHARFYCYHKSNYYKSMFENAIVGKSDLVSGDGLGIMIVYAAMKYNNRIGSLVLDPKKEFKWQNTIVAPITVLDLPDEKSER